MRTTTHRRRRSGVGQRGAALLLFTLMLPTLILPIVGLAIDLSMLYLVQAKLQAAVDGAALGSGRLLGTVADTERVADQFLRANFPEGFWGAHLIVNNEDIDYTKTLNTHRIQITARAQVPLLFMRMFNYEYSIVRADSVATKKDTRVVMVLDRSASMSSKIGVLRSKAIEFVAKFTPGTDQLGFAVFGTSGIVGYPTYARPYPTDVSITGGPNAAFLTKTNPPTGPIVTAINAMNSGGNTNMTEGLALAWLELQRAHNRDVAAGLVDDRLNTIVLFTDGMANTFSVFANDPIPQRNAIKTTSSCIYRNAADVSQQMIGSIGRQTDRLNKLANYDTAQSTTWWLQNASSDYSARPQPKKPFTGCDGLPEDTSTYMSRIPPLDRYGTSTAGTSYSISRIHGANGSISVPGFATKVYKPDDYRSLDVLEQLEIASWNTMDNLARRIRTDATIRVAIYVIAYTPMGGTDKPLLLRVANDNDCPTHSETEPTGLYVQADNDAELESAFSTVASSILRLAE